MRNALVGEEGADVSDSGDGESMLANRISKRPRWSHGKIVTVCRELEIPCNAKKWASDDTPNLKTIGVTPCDPANFVKPLQWDDLFVRRDLQNRIGGGVENRTPGLNVLRAELLEDCSTAPRAIADELNRRFAFDCADQFVGETLEHC